MDQNLYAANKKGSPTIKTRAEKANVKWCLSSTEVSLAASRLFEPHQRFPHLFSLIIHSINNPHHNN